MPWSICEHIHAAQIVSVDEEEDEIEALNLGIIAAYYYIQYTTIHILGPRCGQDQAEGPAGDYLRRQPFDDLPMRPGVPALLNLYLPFVKGCIGWPCACCTCETLSLLEHVGLCCQPTGGSIVLRMKTLAVRINRWCADVLRYLDAPEGVVQ